MKNKSNSLGFGSITFGIISILALYGLREVDIIFQAMGLALLTGVITIILAIAQKRRNPSWTSKTGMILGIIGVAWPFIFFLFLVVTIRITGRGFSPW